MELKWRENFLIYFSFCERKKGRKNVFWSCGESFLLYWLDICVARIFTVLSNFTTFFSFTWCLIHFLTALSPALTSAWEHLESYHFLWICDVCSWLYRFFYFNKLFFTVSSWNFSLEILFYIFKLFFFLKYNL